MPHHTVQHLTVLGLLTKESRKQTRSSISVVDTWSPGVQYINPLSSGRRLTDLADYDTSIIIFEGDALNCLWLWLSVHRHPPKTPSYPPRKLTVTHGGRSMSTLSQPQCPCSGQCCCTHFVALPMSTARVKDATRDH